MPKNRVAGSPIKLADLIAGAATNPGRSTKRGRPRKEDPYELTPAQQQVIDYARRARTLHRRTILTALGFNPEIMRGWLAPTTWKHRPPNENFTRQWRMLEREFSGDQGLPPTGSFQEFREKHLNVTSYNPFSGRTSHVGVTYPYMVEACEALDDPQVRRLGILWPVRFAKTTLVEQFVVKRLCENPNLRVILVCSNIAHAKERVYNIQRMLTDDVAYPSLHEGWGPWISKADDSSKPWTATSFYVRGRNSPERSPSVSAYGISAKIYGARGDLIILDDVDDESNGPDERRTIVRAINGPIMSRLTEGGKIIYIGTRMGVSDVPSALQGFPGWRWITRSAINEDGTPLEPEMYSMEELEAFRGEMGEELFQMMLMNNPAPEGSMVFPPDLIDTAKGAYSVGEAPADWERIVSMDPATAGRAAIIALAHNPETREVRVLDLLVKDNPRHDGMREMIALYLSRYQPTWCIIEAQGGSALFSDVPEVRAMIYDSGARLKEFKTTGDNKHDARVGVPLLATMMGAGRLRFPNADGVAAMRMKPLYDDMMGWVPRTPTRLHRQDALMALWFAASTIHTGNYAARLGTITDPMTAARPWARPIPVLAQPRKRGIF